MINRLFSSIEKLVQGGIYFSKNKYLTSREFYKTAYHFLLIESDSVGMKGYLTNIGNTFSITKELDSSLYYYELGEVLGKMVFFKFHWLIKAFFIT